MSKYNMKKGKSQGANEKNYSSIDKYSNKKKIGAKAAEYMTKHLTPGGVVRMKNCGTHLGFATDRDKKKRKLTSGDFCKNRFCPMCRWREAKKDALKIGTMMKHIKQRHKKEFIFIGFTAPNVKGAELKAEVTKFNIAFKNLMKRKEVLAVSHGYIRKLELTYNQKRNDFHPHFHVIMAVNRSYFTGKAYIQRGEWLEMWQEVMNDYDITQLDVRKFKDGGNMDKAIYEIATYAGKDSDLYGNGQEVFDHFYNALHGRQILTYSGIFAEANNLYKEGKLNYLIEPDMTEYIYYVRYEWENNAYAEKECRELTEAERARINRLFNEAHLK